MKRKVRRALVPARHVWLVEGTGCLFDTKERAERFAEWMDKKEMEKAEGKRTQFRVTPLLPDDCAGEPAGPAEFSVPDHWDS
jgi:hypothetical protein